MGISDITSGPLEGVGISSRLPGVRSCSNSEEGFKGEREKRRIWGRQPRKKILFFPRQTLNLAEDDGVCVRCFLSSISQPVEQPSSIPNRHNARFVFSRHYRIPPISRRCFAARVRGHLHLGTILFIFVSFKFLGLMNEILIFSMTDIYF